MTVERRKLAKRQARLSQAIEALESRTLLATITGPGALTYKDANDNEIRITVSGNVTAEFIFGRVDEDTNRLILGPDPTPTGDNDIQGRDLFKVYVSQADETGIISIYQIDDQGNPTPFNGSAGTIKAVNAQDPGDLDFTTTPGGSTGVVYIGARTLDLEAIEGSREADRPILSRGMGGPVAIGVHPAVDRYRAGMEMAPGQRLGAFFVGGTLTGWVDAGGSINTFYTGALLTGQAGGQSEGPPTIPNNFFIDGDLRELIVRGSIGTTIPTTALDPNYVTGFDMRVTGKVGEVKTYDSFMGAMNVVHAGGNADRLAAIQTEIEERSGDQNGRMFPQARLNDATFNNDSAGTAQYLGSLRARRGGGRVELTGTLVATNQRQDYLDQYALGLRAGQSVVVRLADESLIVPVPGVLLVPDVNIGVFDPDGRLVATDHDAQDPGVVSGQPFVFRAETPGIYRFVVGAFTDADFNGVGDFSSANVGPIPYRLTLDGIGDLGLGALVAADNITDVAFPSLFVGGPADYQVFVQNGDLGVATALGNIRSQSNNTFWVRQGNLRVVEAPEIGEETAGQGGAPGTIGSGIMLNVPRGDVGLIRSTTGVLNLNSRKIADPSLGTPATLLPAIGGSYQVVHAAGTFYGNLVANQNIGVIRAAEMDVRDPGWFQVNADGTGPAGQIDLIDVDGQFGTITGGGPAIVTGPGGNVRYMSIGGPVFRDIFFGGGAPEDTLYVNQDEIRLIDDSGSRIALRPEPELNPNFVFGGTNSRFIYPNVNVVAYGIRGSGGVAVISVDVTPTGFMTGSGSLEVAVGGNRRGATAELGRVTTVGPGAPITLNPATGVPIMTPLRGPGFQATNTGTAHFARFEGSGRLDVFEVSSRSDVTQPLGSGQMSEIRNNTNGEIVNVNTGSVGTLHSGGTIGLLRSSTGAVVTQRGTPSALGNSFPFVNQGNGIVSGHVVSMRAGGGIGNVMVTGNVGEIVANANGRSNGTGQFEGINAPILLVPDPTPGTGRLFNISIGQGILPSGNGNVGRAGIYADRIDAVTGRNADIRGTISAINGIGRIGLNNGSIINATIMVPTAHTMTREIEPLAPVLTNVTGTSGVNLPSFEIGRISVAGQNSGIIGTQIAAADVGEVLSRGGFGIVNSSITTDGDGVMDRVVAGGLGLRDVLLSGGASINSVVAEGKSRNVNVRNYSPRVRYSERMGFDPFFQGSINRTTDLHAYLGTSATTGKIKRVTDTAVIENSIFRGQRDLRSVSAEQIRGETMFNFANIIGTVRARNQIAGLSMTGGRLDLLQVDGNASALDVTIAGPVRNVNIAKLFAANSIIRAQGNQGTMGTVAVGGDMAGDVIVTGAFDTLRVRGDLEASSLVRARSLGRREIGGNIFGTIQTG